LSKCGSIRSTATGINLNGINTDTNITMIVSIKPLPPGGELVIIAAPGILETQI
jgi:hypothetical protein